MDQTPRVVPTERPIVVVSKARMKRITGWITLCRACNSAGLSRNKKMAVKNAIGHARSAHSGDAEIRTEG